MPHTIKLSPVKSSQLSAIGHDASRNLLVIQFNAPDGKPGRKYAYEKVSAAQFAALRDSDSLGKHFNTHIRGSENHPHYEMHEKKKG